MKKTEGRKSRETVPLKEHPINLRCRFAMVFVGATASTKFAIIGGFPDHTTENSSCIKLYI
jgi:hypothetical protein